MNKDETVKRVDSPQTCAECPHKAEWLTQDYRNWCTHPTRVWQDLVVVDGYPLGHDVGARRWSECPYSKYPEATDAELLAKYEAHIEDFRRSAQELFEMTDESLQK